MNGRRYYWFAQGGRRVYSSHPPHGFLPAYGPAPGVSSLGVQAPGAVADLDAPLSASERATQATQLKQAQARLHSLELRIGQQRDRERLRVHSVHTHQK